VPESNEITKNGHLELFIKKSKSEIGFRKKFYNINHHYIEKSK